ncbi:hypothetical protein AGMMS49938_09650 [Fibrobacterales bacterium]|nr:hypothetical protein AGMMS49938_09650 [Fibrobacterales bacterium]
MKFRFSLQPILNHREALERNAEIALGREMQRQVVLENEQLVLLEELENLTKERGTANLHSGERFMDFVSYSHRLKRQIAQKKNEIEKQKESVTAARNELIKKTQEKKAIEVLQDSQERAFKLAEKRQEAKQADEVAGQRKQRAVAETQDEAQSN